MAHHSPPVGAARTLSLSQLNQWIAQQEEQLGPVVTIEQGLDDEGADATAVVFNLSETVPPDRFAQVSQKVGSRCILPRNHVLVCSGRAYISGNLLAVCVSRPE